MEDGMQSVMVTTKGQVTIPVEIRKKFGLSPGEKVMFAVEDEKIVLRPLLKRVEDSFGLVSSDLSVSLADMDAIIRKQAGR